MLKDWLSLQSSQWKGKEELAEIQSRKLREIVNHAYRKVPLYRKVYDAAGVNPSSVTNTASIRNLTILTKEHIRNTTLEERTAPGIDPSSCSHITTSGSTGEPITVLEEPRARSHRVALYMRRFWAYGIRPSHKVCNIVAGMNAGGLSSNAAGLLGNALRRKVLTLPLTTDLPDQVNLICNWKPDVIIGAPSHFRNLIRISEESGRRFALKVAMTTGEMLDPPTRKLIGDSLHAEVYDSYGTSEVGGVTWECPTHSGYHVNIESFVLECLRDGEPVAAGETGQLCITNLYRKATPMIRYLFDDMATLVDDDCQCGRGLPLMEGIQGRVVDYIKTTDGRQISPYAVMFMLESVPGLAQYKVIQRSDRSIQMLVRTLNNEIEPVLQSLRLISTQLFGNMLVDIKVVGKIEIPEARKYKVVESHVNG
jgi:phenylacetate-CoA ligase